MMRAETNKLYLRKSSVISPLEGSRTWLRLQCPVRAASDTDRQAKGHECITLLRQLHCTDTGWETHSTLRGHTWKKINRNKQNMDP